jgi:hypothetical protein
MIPKDSDNIMNKAFIGIIILGLYSIYRILNEDYIKKYGDKTLVFIGNDDNYIKLSSDKQEIEKMKGMVKYEIEIEYKNIYAVGFKTMNSIDYIEKIHHNGFNVVLADANRVSVYPSSDEILLYVEI